MEREINKRHKWDDGKRKFTVCTVCGCEKLRGVYSIQYTLKGKTTQVAPPCLTANPDLLTTSKD